MTRAFELPQRSDLSAMLRLAVPVVVAQVGMMLLGVVDTMVVGRVSADALAAVAIGNLAIMVVSGFVYGLLIALDPLVAQALGAGDEAAARRSVQRGLVLATCVTVPATAVLLPLEPLLHLARQPEGVVPIAVGYTYRCLPGLLPFYAFVVLRHTLQALERVRPIVVAVALANVLNLALDLVLVFGWLGFPAMGAFGSAWATSICRAALLLGLARLAWKDLGPLIFPIGREVFRFRPLWNTVRLGTPIGIQLQLELGAFGVIALLMGTLGTVAMAAHQVAINLASLTFMVPLGISSAASVRVGHGIGRRDGAGARRAAAAAVLCGVGFMVVTAALFIGFPVALASLYTPDLEVVALAAALIPIAGVFQVFDGLQVVSSGILRGIGDTRVPMAISVLGFWLLGIPISVALGFPLGLGPRGLWWGLVAALAVLATLLLLRVASRLSKPVDRTAVE